MDILSVEFNTKMLIDGKWVEGSEPQGIEVVNPSNNEPLFKIHPAGLEDMNAAVEASDKAFKNPQWNEMDGIARGRLLSKIADGIRNHAEKFSLIESLETGKTIREARLEVVMTVRHFEYFAGWTSKILGNSIPEPGRFTYTLREPYGVIASIVPWNSTLKLMARSLAASLACGNTTVIKASIIAPATILEFGRIVQEAELPSGVVNIITGPGSTTGAALVAHPKVRKVVFIGGTDAGVQILRQAANNVTPVTLELGGKGPIIVTEDVDIEEAVEGVLSQAFTRKGEVCFAGTRLFLHNKIYDRFMERTVERTKQIKLGWATDEDSDMGPLISKEQLNRVMQYIEDGKKAGANVAAGGKRPSDSRLREGNFLLPTILTEVAPAMRIAKEEIFGPVLCVFRYNDVEEAIREANNVVYGLAAYIWSNDIRTAHKIAHRLETGNVFVNTYGYSSEIPFGGYKMSGFGREHGLDAIREYTQLKSICIGLDRYKPKISFGGFIPL